MIYNELSRICKSAPSPMIRTLSGTDTMDAFIMTREQLDQITKAELDLLTSIDFDANFELPFQHFELWKNKLQAKIPNENFLRICNKVIVDICLVIYEKKNFIGSPIYHCEAYKWYYIVI